MALNVLNNPVEVLMKYGVAYMLGVPFSLILVWFLFNQAC